MFDSKGKPFEWLEKGPKLEAFEINQLLQKVEDLAKQCTVVAIFGSSPHGIDKSYFTKLIQVAKANCYQVIVAISGPLLKGAIQEKSKLIKPNKDETSAYAQTIFKQ